MLAPTDLRSRLKDPSLLAARAYVAVSHNPLCSGKAAATERRITLQ
jgi:hypothetical protein